jgi:hypothetical protein
MFTLTDHNLCTTGPLPGRLPGLLNPGHNLVGLRKRGHRNELNQRRALHALMLILEDNSST